MGTGRDNEQFDKDWKVNDADAVVPAGGTEAQALVKAGSGDYDTGWVTPYAGADKEDSLGDPTLDGSAVVSTSGGTRSWQKLYTPDIFVANWRQSSGSARPTYSNTTFAMDFNNVHQAGAGIVLSSGVFSFPDGTYKIRVDMSREGTGHGVIQRINTNERLLEFGGIPSVNDLSYEEILVVASLTDYEFEGYVLGSLTVGADIEEPFESIFKFATITIERIDVTVGG